MAFVSWLLGTFAAVAVGHLLLRLIQFWKYVKIINKIPGPKCLPIFGNALDVFVPFEDITNTLLKMFKQQQLAGKSIIRVWFGPHPKVIILKGSSCEAILKSKNANKSMEYEFAKELLGNGLLFRKGEFWEKRRKMINPSFHVSVLKEFIPIFNELVEICLHNIKKVDDGRIFDVIPYFKNLSLDMICETTMGVKVNAQESTNNKIVEVFNEFSDLLLARFVNPFLYPSFIYNLTSYRKREIKYRKIIETFVLKVIREKVKYLAQCKLSQSIQNGVERANEKLIYGEKRRLATLDLLIEATCDGRKLTDRELLDEVTILIAGGHETIPYSIAFALYLLGLNPEAQKRAQQELDTALGESGRPITSDDLLSLKYLDAVIKETHRLYPPIPQIARMMDEDVVIGTGYTIPAGTTVAMFMFTIHRDPKVFPDPDKFDPERFLGANGPSIYEYMPFSQGPRNCIGSKLAVWETKITVAKILQKYDIISHDKPQSLKLASSPELRTSHGLRLSLQKRRMH